MQLHDTDKQGQQGLGRAGVQIHPFTLSKNQLQRRLLNRIPPTSARTNQDAETKVRKSLGLPHRTHLAWFSKSSVTLVGFAAVFLSGTLGEYLV